MITQKEMKKISFSPNNEKKMWRRPSEWCKNPTIFKDDASPGDIEQGQLGDCW